MTGPTPAAALLSPRSVAVVGASDRPGSMSGLILRLLDRFKFPGPVFAVNPNHDTVAGRRCFASVGDIPGDQPVDLAILSIPADRLVPAAVACGERGVRALVVLSSGFAETGDRGADLEAELASVAGRFGMSVAGPNCAGVANFRADFVAYGTTNFADLDEIHRGGLAILSASGGLGNTLFTYCQERRLGVGHLIGLGNETVTTAADHLDELIADPAVSMVAAYLEAVREPARFFAAADRAAAAWKPVVVLKAGRSEAGLQSIRTHTAALGGSARAFAGAFRQHGVVQVEDLDELVDVAMVLDRCPPVGGNRIGVFSLAGGGTGLLADVAADHGFVMAGLSPPTTAALTELLPPIATVGNPLDTTAGFARRPDDLRAGLRLFAADPGIDAVVFFPLASQADYAQQIADDVVAVAADSDTPILCVWTATRRLEPGAWRTLHEHGVPLFTSATACFRALRKAREFAAWQEQRLAEGAVDFGPHHGRRVEPSDDAVTMLPSFGIRLPETEIVTDAAAAVTAVQRRGEPVVMKIVSPQIPHKTEAGGVAVGVVAADAAEVFAELLDRAARFDPGAVLEGVAVQELVPPGVEMLVGVTTDDQLGPVLTIGMGGVLTEILDDVTSRPVPVSRADVETMLGEVRGAALLAGVRGRPPADVDAFVDLVLGVSALADALRERRPELDLNPVVVLPAGAVAVDHLVVLR